MLIAHILLSPKASLGAEDTLANRKKWGCLPCGTGIWTQVWFCSHSQKTTKLSEEVGFLVSLGDMCGLTGLQPRRAFQRTKCVTLSTPSSFGDQMGKQLKFCKLFSTLYSEQEWPSLGSRATMLNYRGGLSLIVPIWNDRPSMAATFPWSVWVLCRRMCISPFQRLLTNGSVWRFKWHVVRIMVPISTSLWV